MDFVQNDWKEALYDELEKPYFAELMDKISDEYSTFEIFPKKEDLFQAFELTPLSNVKVVILGQDPYHNVNQAHGLSFSVKPGVDIPPSLRNIYKELESDLGFEIPNNGYLTKWASQGVFLLNTVLTVRAHEAASHQGLGWEHFTDEVIRVLNQQNRPIVFMLWGGPAKKKMKLLDNPAHLVLTAAHPSPLSAYRGFFGCEHFSKCNEFLISHGTSPIDWQIDDI